MNTLDNRLLQEPWLSVEDDSLTGLRNMLALIADLSHETQELGTAVGFDLCGLREINESEGFEAGDRALAAFGDGMRRAALLVNSKEIGLYRIGGDEFCALISGPSSQGTRLLDLLHHDDKVPVFRYSVVKLSKETLSSKDRFFEIWAALEQGLRQKRYVGADPMTSLATRLVEQIQETVEHLKASRRMAYTDDISGLPNQRAAMYFIDLHMRKEAAISEPSPAPMSLLFIDGDNLRQYNDVLGYQAGNDMIRRLGSVLTGSTSKGELVARWLSGDEFMIVLPGHSREQAVEKAKVICERVRVESIDWTYPVTISVGVATYPDDGLELGEILAKVEAANARAKSSGKDQVCTPE